MKRWFAALPIHRKLVAMALLVTAVALLTAMAGLILLDIWRYQEAALDDVTSLAQVVAENTAAALAFEDAEEAEATLATARVRPRVTRACVYLTDTTLLAGYARSRERPCADRLPAGVVANERFVDVQVPVMRRQQMLGTVYAERDRSDLGARIVFTVGAGVTVLLLAGGLAYTVAWRVQRTVSTPIVQLAAAARHAVPEQEYAIPDIASAPDEVGDLVRAFSGMVDRARESNRNLVHANEALQREIDERRLVEAEREALLVREREASRLKDEFLAAVSHELRTPLNAIMGWVQILAKTEPNPQTMMKAIDVIGRNARAQTRVIEDLVDVSRIVTGKLSLRLEPVDLRAPMEAAVDVIRPAASTKGVILDLSVPAEPCPVHGDADRLQQVVWNLLSNAMKFTPEHGRVSVTLARVDGAYALTVADTGIGIPAVFLPYVFDRFRQADGSMTREHGGLGLGLAIVKELSELHGGRVTVASEGSGRGTTFTVTLPRLAGDGATARPSTSTATPDAPSVAGVSVLAVDDNRDALDLILEGLTSAGARVRVAASGPEAVRMWQREPADVLICDLAMPGMSGFDVVRQIRRLDAASARKTVAIAVTAHTSPAYIQQCVEAGFDRHLAKPYATADLIEAVATAVDRPEGEDMRERSLS